MRLMIRHWLTFGPFIFILSKKNSPLAESRELVLTPRMHEEIKLTREVSAIQIPSGDTLLLPAGTAVFITQRLGGTYTVATSQGLARISSQDADALGVNPEEEQKKQAEVVRLKDAPLEEQVWSQLKGVYDPEIPVDIVTLARFARIINRTHHAVASAIGGIMNLDFERCQHVLWVVGAEKNTAIRFLFHLEFEIEDEITIRIRGPQGFMIFCDEHAIFKTPLAGICGVLQVTCE